MHFLHWIESHQDQSATRLDCHPCPLLCCHQVCNHSARVLEHVSHCDSFWNGEYRCPKHRAPERSASVGTARLRKCLHYPAQLCKRVHSKVHEKALLAGTKRVLQKLGSTRQRRSSLSSSPSRSSSTRPDELHEMSSSPSRSSSTRPDELHEMSSSPSRSSFTMPDKLHEMSSSPNRSSSMMPDKLHEMSSSPSRSSSTMPDELYEHSGTKFRPIPELYGTQLSELPAAESTCAELCAECYPAELTADHPFTTIPYGPSNNTSSPSGIDRPLSIAPSSEDPTLGLDSAMTESDAWGNISITLRLPTHHSGQHAFPYADRPSTNVDPLQGYSDLVSPISPFSQLSPASQVSFPSSQGDIRSSTINTSGVQNLRRPSDHHSCSVVSPLTSDERACPTCGSTGPSAPDSAVFAQPANEYISDGRGSYRPYSAVPLSMTSIPKRRPLPPKQSEENIAEQKDYTTLITDFPPRVIAENAHLMDGFLPNSLPLRDEEWPIPYLGSNSSPYTNALTLDDRLSDDQLVTIPERYERNRTSFDESLSTAHHIHLADKTRLSTTTAQGLVTDTSIATSVITDTERRFSAGRLPTVLNPRVAASTPPRNPSQQDQVSSDYLKCPFHDCKARYKGISKHGPSNLRKHIRITHAKDPLILECPDSSCKSTFNREHNLRSHWHTYHENRTDAELALSIVTQKHKKTGKRRRSQVI